MLIDQGIDAVRVDVLAKTLAVTRGSFYWHFKDKAEILAEICEAGFGKLAAVTDEIEAETQTAEVALRRKMRAYYEFGFANPNAYRLIYLTRPGEAGGAEEAARRVGRGLFERLRSTVEDMSKEGRLNRDPHTATQLIWAGVHGLVSLMLTKPYFDWDDRDTLFDAMFNAILSDLTRE